MAGPILEEVATTLQSVAELVIDKIVRFPPNYVSRALFILNPCRGNMESNFLTITIFVKHYLQHITSIGLNRCSVSF
jgi:hypothetical protein